ncbi:hypothetical protein [Streptomyces cyaneofuscatus]|uniref:hypothetical protein n=1 Tax=Streptomyces cyaneofuscatus TaxID=66883 RepID=UPI0038158152|nr:hypothetical protein [Streptomyces sp. MT29]
MPRLTRAQSRQLDDLEYFLLKILADLTNPRTVVTMRSAGAATTEFYNERTDSWLIPVRPSALAYLDHAQRIIDTMRAQAAPKAVEQ